MGLWKKLRAMLGGERGDLGERGGLARPPSPQALFSAQVAGAARKVPGVVSVSENATDFSLAVRCRDPNGDGDKDFVMYLGNYFAETRDLDPDRRAARIDFFVTTLTGLTSDAPGWDEAQERLVPLVRASSLYVGVPTGDGDDDDDASKNLLRRPFVPFLIECAAIDSETSFRMVGPSEAAAWGVPVDAVFAAARENAARCFGPDDVELYDEDAPYPLFHVGKNDTYESSRLLLPGWLASFAGRVHGRPVAAVPERSTLLVGGDGDERCLRRLAEAAQAEYGASPRSISPALYTVDGAGRVVPLVLPADHPQAHQVALGHVTLAVAEYQAQTERLQAAVGEDVFVAAYKGIDPKQGAPFGYTTWAQDVATLLPRADVVFLGVGAEHDETLRVSWDALLELAGDCLQPVPDLDPPRWRTVGWPAPAVLDQLRDRARASGP
jgi:hypothetical protein